MPNSQKVDILSFAAHPDDSEISAGGSIAKAIAEGRKVGLIDLTAGELGSRGSAELRAEESAKADEILGITLRENLGLRDGFFEHNEESLTLIIQSIRKYRPEIILCNAPSDRHPDHGRASKLVSEASFYAGLVKIATKDESGEHQEAWRPKAVYHYVQDYYLKPDFVIDVTAFWDKKIEALKCYSSQFFDAKSKEPITPISGAEFFEFLKGRALQMGRPAGFLLAEGFIVDRTIGVDSFFALR